MPLFQHPPTVFSEKVAGRLQDVSAAAKDSSDQDVRDLVVLNHLGDLNGAAGNVGRIQLVLMIFKSCYVVF